MTDTYTKIILTVIAACLVAIAVRQPHPVPMRSSGWGATEALKRRATSG